MAANVPLFLFLIFVVMERTCYGTKAVKPLMPYNMNDKTDYYILKLNKAWITGKDKYEFNYVYINFDQNQKNHPPRFKVNHQDNYINAMSFPRANKIDKIQFNVRKETIQYGVIQTKKDDRITGKTEGASPISKQTPSKNEMKIDKCWLAKVDKDSRKTVREKVPIRIALSRLQVLTHYKHYFEPENYKKGEGETSTKLPHDVIEDAITLSALSQYAYSHEIRDLLSISDKIPAVKQFYGGEVVKQMTLNPVVLPLDTEIRNMKKYGEVIESGVLYSFAWKYKNVFVVSFRGTVQYPTPANWHINFKTPARRITYNGVQGDVHSGMYDIMALYFDKLVHIFEPYKGQKRIIITGHSVKNSQLMCTYIHSVFCVMVDNVYILYTI